MLTDRWMVYFVAGWLPRLCRQLGIARGRGMEVAMGKRGAGPEKEGGEGRVAVGAGEEPRRFGPSHSLRAARHVGPSGNFDHFKNFPWRASEHDFDSQ